MHKLEYKFSNNIPNFSCNFCGNCSSFVESVSYASIKNRGCCWYFPRYTLMDIKNIIGSGNKEFIHKLLNMKDSKIAQYHIDVYGEFDEESYKEFLHNNIHEARDFDYKLFFRLCPFATTAGCSLEFKLRSHPCNFYLCREVLEMCGSSYDVYSEERKDYYSYCNYFSETLKYALIDNGVSLVDNPLKALEIIEATDIPDFLPRKLSPINFNAHPNRDDMVAG